MVFLQTVFEPHYNIALHAFQWGVPWHRTLVETLANMLLEAHVAPFDEALTGEGSLRFLLVELFTG